MPKAKISIGEQYLLDVRDEKQLTSKHVRQQVLNHFSDLEKAHERGLYFDLHRGLRFVAFIRDYVCGIDGTPYRVEPWEAAILLMFYGWVLKETRYPRYKYAYIEIGRGNKKSMLLSAMCVHRLLSEDAAEIYCAATDRATARVIHDTAELMVKRSPELSDRVTVYRNNLHCMATGSKMEPCSAEGKTLFAHSRPSFVALDELHLHPDTTVWSAFSSALDKRPTAQMVVLTNSGFDRMSLCWQKREYSIKVLNRIVPDDTWFSMIYGLDDEDLEDPEGWRNEANWIKANPSLGNAVSLTALRQSALRAAEDPLVLNEFLRFKLSVWTNSQTAWVPIAKWQACGGKIDPESLYGRPCFGGLDLSTGWDITAFVLVFPPYGEDDKWLVLCWFFLPEDTVAERRDKVPYYDVWAKQGNLILTESNGIDYDVVRKVVNEAADKYAIREIAYDPWNATQLVGQLQGDGFTMVTVRQGFPELNDPMKRLTEMVRSGDLAHGDNPVLSWMASNVLMLQDAAGNMKPDKAKSKEKIDGISALVTAMSRAMRVSLEEPPTWNAEVW
jgi:phage terminase large subunit-like protein